MIRLRRTHTRHRTTTVGSSTHHCGGLGLLHRRSRRRRSMRICIPGHGHGASLDLTWLIVAIRRGWKDGMNEWRREEVLLACFFFFFLIPSSWNRCSGEKRDTWALIPCLDFEGRLEERLVRKDSRVRESSEQDCISTWMILREREREREKGCGFPFLFLFVRSTET